MGRLSKEAAADQKLIEDNPKASAKELLALGLSQAGYEKLMNEEPQEQKPEIKTEPERETAPTVNDEHGPVMPKVEKQSAAVPKLQQPVAVYDGDMVTVVSPEGVRTRMTRVHAERFKRGGRNADRSR